MKYQVIFLDADNTILDFNKAEIYALRKTFEKAGYPYSEEVLKLYDHYNMLLWKRFEQNEITMAELKRTRFNEVAAALHIAMDPEEMSRIYMNYLGEADFEIEGAYEMCQQLSQYYQLVVMTNGITKVQKSRFRKSRLSQFISYYFISEEIGKSKPHADFFEYALDKLGISDKSQVLMIGDSLSSDMKGGENARIDTCFFNPYGIMATVKVRYEVKHLSEIPLLLEEIEKQYKNDHKEKEESI